MHPFLLTTNHNNPPGNNQIFEEYFARRFLAEGKEYGRAFLPVTWTNYYVSQGYKCATPLKQYLLKFLDKTKKWFTVCQWDTGVIWKPDNLDLFVFSQGGVGDYPIPLNCEIPINGGEFSRNYFCSFIGKIWDRHPVRDKMYNELSKHHEIIMQEDPEHRYALFKYLAKKSLFTLCPRGFGKTSFRICESLYYRSIPVYIYDEDWSPFPDLIKDDYMVKCHISEIDKLYERLVEIAINEQEINRLRANGEKVYRDYFSYDGCYNRIIDKLEEGV